MEQLKNQETELDRILREASSFDDFGMPIAQEPVEEVKVAAKPATKPTPKKPAPKRPERGERGVPVEKKIMANIRANAEKKAEEKRNAEEQQAIQAQQAALGKAPAAESKAEEQQSDAKAEKAAAAVQAAAKKIKSVKLPTMAKTEKKAEQQTEGEEKAPAKLSVKLPKVSREAKKAKEPKPRKEPKPAIHVPAVITMALAVVSVVCLLWVGVNVHPDTGTATAAAASKKLDMSEKMDIYMNNAASDALSNLTYIKKLYTIPESDLVAPKPQAKFGSTNDPAEVKAVVEQAAELLDGQTLAWNENLDFWDGEPIQYYYDETILAITWKEIIDGKMCSFGEVKVAHGSQLRRALAGNEYGSSVEEYPTKMAAKANAVLAINGDFYNFRDFGITVYQRELYRHAPKSVDTCYFTSEGEMIFSKRGELSDKAEAEQFVKDNDVVFSVAFGPVLVENGEIVETTQYPIGEIQKNYSRAAIGQRGELHYVLMTINYEGPCQVTTTLAHAAEILFSKGVEKAYTLDGGQTSSMVFNGELVNRVDWGNERTMSDIIYFASAVPNKEGNA